LAAVLELDLEAAREVGVEPYADRLAGSDVALEVVAVDVHLVADVGAHDDDDGVALPRLRADDAVHRLAAPDADDDLYGLRRGSGHGLRRGGAVRLGDRRLRGRR